MHTVGIEHDDLAVDVNALAENFSRPVLERILDGSWAPWIQDSCGGSLPSLSSVTGGPR